MSIHPSPAPAVLSVLSADQVLRALSVPDLTDPGQGPHAMQQLLAELLSSLSGSWAARLIERRGSPIVPVADNYDRLRYPADGAARDARYTRYVCEGAVLRSQTSAMVPPALRALAAGWQDPLPSGITPDVLLACPGVVYRRDCIDRLHVGEPHQVDLWRLRPSPGLGEADLEAMIAAVVASALPGWEHRTLPASHPYTLHGRQIDVRRGEDWVEIGECGLAHPEVLRGAGLDPDRCSGLAMGLGLDRLVMLRKGLDDIRLLRSADPRIASQMQDLSPYRPVSSMPPVRRDLSIAVADDTTAEELGDRVRASLGERARSIESVEVLSETPPEALPPAAIERIGLGPGQKNVLLRIVLRDLDRTLTHAEANQLRDAIYEVLHQGSSHQWAARREPGGAAR